MKNNVVGVLAIAAAGLVGSSAIGQTVAKIDFVSVGRAAPLAADINKYEMTGATSRRPQGPGGPGQPGQGGQAARPGQGAQPGQPAQAGPPPEPFFIGSARNGATPPGIKPLAWTSSRRRISTRTARSGPTRATSAATARPRSKSSGARNGAQLDRRQPAGIGRVGLLRSRLSARSHREPVSVQDGAGALRGAARGDARSAAARRSTPTRRVPSEWNGRYMHPGRTPGNQYWYRMRHDPDADDPVAADARVSDAHGAGGLPPRQHEHAAVAVAVLLARRLHAPLARGRGVGAPHHGHAVRSCRSWPASRATSSPTSTSAASSTWTAPCRGSAQDVPRWYGETIGFWDGDTLITWTSNIQGWKVHARVRVLEQAADDRDLHAEPRRERQVPRPEPRGDLLRSRGARGAGPHRPQLREDRAASTKATRTSSSSACRRSTRSRARRRPVAPGTRDRVRGARHVRPAVGADLGEVLGAGHGAAEGRGHLQLRREEVRRASVPARSSRGRRLRTHERRESRLRLPNAR